MPWLTLAGIGLAAVANAWIATLEETGAPGMIAVDSFRVFANFVFLLAGALFAAFLAWWCDLRRLQPTDFLDPAEPHEPTDAVLIRQAGIVAGD